MASKCTSYLQPNMLVVDVEKFVSPHKGNILHKKVFLIKHACVCMCCVNGLLPSLLFSLMKLNMLSET